MNHHLFGELELLVYGEENFNLETFVGAKLQITKEDGKTVEFDVCDILHKNLKTLDSETGIEIADADQVNL